MRRLLLLIVLVALAVPAAGVQAKGKGTPPSPAQRTALQAYAAATWHSFVMMTNPQTGLTADNVSAEGVRAKYTSPTNIASYIWSALSARDVGVINPQEARDPDRPHAAHARAARAVAR